MILWMDQHLRQILVLALNARKLMAWQMQHTGCLRKRVPLIDIAGKGNRLLSQIFFQKLFQTVDQLGYVRVSLVMTDE
jgi:hypothetical protein